MLPSRAMCEGFTRGALWNRAQIRQSSASNHETMRWVMWCVCCGARLREQIDLPHTVENAEHEEDNGEDEGDDSHVMTPLRARMKQIAPTMTQYQPNGRKSFDRK